MDNRLEPYSRVTPSITDTPFKALYECYGCRIDVEDTGGFEDKGGNWGQNAGKASWGLAG